MNLFLRIIGIANIEIINKLLETKVISEDQVNTIAIFCDYAEVDIPLEHSFKYLICEDNKKSMQLLCKVKYVMQAQGLFYDRIPFGHNSLVFFECTEENKKILLKELPSAEGWDFNVENIYLSDSPTLTLVSKD